jgi:branched-chain amino acid transport system permease protein
MRVPPPAWIALAGIAFASLPFFAPPDFYESFLYLIFLWVVLATSWNILSGYSGYFSFGHGAFFGAGMYTTATLTSALGVPFLWSLPAAAFVAAALGIGVGAVAFRLRRLRGELFALLTLAVTFVLATIALNTPIDGGPGVYLSGVRVPKLFPSLSSTFYLLALVTAIVTLCIAYAVYRSKLGAGLFAIRDDEDVAEAVGVPTFCYKILAFGLSCALAGAAGGIHALFVSYVTVAETFSIMVPLSVVMMSVLGGTRHWLGPALGATVVTALLYAFTAGDHPVAGRAAVGVILIAVILLLPQGLLGRFTRPARQKRDAAARSPAAADATARRARKPEATALLAIRGLCKSFSGIRALDGIDLEVLRGEILCLVGPNGSGKSTLINLVSGHYRPDAGHILFEGREIAGLAAHRIRCAGIARTFQIPRPFAHLTVLQNAALPARFGKARLNRRAAEREARRWLDFTGLAAKTDALPGELNLHQLKFLELARALASRPDLLMLDEVLSGLTPSEIDKAIGTLRDIRDQGTTIVFVEHVMRAVMELADRIVVLNHGRVIAVGDPREVTRRPEVVTAYLGKPHA